MAKSEFDIRSTNSARSASRLPGLEWFRVGLTLAVVALHAGMAYLTRPFPGLAWSTYDEPSRLADWVCWTTNAVVMPGFFILGGYGASRLLDRLGPRVLCRDRIKRLGGPFALGCVLILPLDLYAWLLGWAADGKIPLRKLKSLRFENGVDEGLWGVSHLWFLQYLLLFSCLYASWRAVVGRLPDRWTERIVSTNGLLAGAAVSSVALWANPQILLGFRHAAIPLPANMAFYLPMFAFGAIWSGQKRDRLGLAHVVAGLALLLVTTPSRDVWLDGSAADAVTRTITVVGYAFAGWLIAGGLFGSARRSETPMPAPVAYLAAASFWIYLIHHPVVGLAQVSLKPFDWSSSTKFVAVFAIGMWLSLGTFEIAVRKTWIGQVLGARRKASKSDTAPVALPEVVRDAA